MSDHPLEDHSSSSSSQLDDPYTQESYPETYKIVDLPLYTYPQRLVILRFPCKLYKWINDPANQWVRCCNGTWNVVQQQPNRYFLCIEDGNKQWRLNVKEQYIQLTASQCYEENYQFYLDNVLYSLKIKQEDHEIFQSYLNALKIKMEEKKEEEEQMKGDLKEKEDKK